MQTALEKAMAGDSDISRAERRRVAREEAKQDGQTGRPRAKDSTPFTEWAAPKSQHLYVTRGELLSFYAIMEQERRKRASIGYKIARVLSRLFFSTARKPHGATESALASQRENEQNVAPAQEG